MPRNATFIAAFRVDPERRADVLNWQNNLDSLAAKQPGFVESVATTPDPDQDDWAAAVTFSSERKLRSWLNSPERADMLAEGDRLGVIESAPPIVLVEGERPPSGVGVFMHEVEPQHVDEFVEVEQDLRDAGRRFPGHQGGVLLPPGKVRNLWISIVRFESDQDLTHWLTSRDRSHLLPRLRSTLDHDFEQFTRSTPFGSIVRFQGDQASVTPQWKVAMVLLLVLYPTVMILSRFLNPILDGLGATPGIDLWIGQICSTALLTWLLMPLATRAFRRWLDPIDGASLRVTLIGVLILLLLYAATLIIFSSIRWLQFWDYSST